MRIAISGSTGLVGSALAEHLEAEGHEVISMVRRAPRDQHELEYDVKTGVIDVDALSRMDVVIHLAGEPIGDSRWSSRKKERILSSRVQSTRLIANAMAACSPKPRALICASAIGYYGDRGAELLDESSEPGDDFLADVCNAWELACEPARKAGIRTVNARIGVVLAPEGGALAKMLTPFKLGLGGVLGSGDQWMSWISLHDVVRGFSWLATTERLEGPVNLVAPNPVDNRRFTRTLAQHLHRPAVVPMPAFAARLAFGERADALLLSSTRVYPARLVADGFAFRSTHLDHALGDLFQETSGEAA